jgi:hypothetical protein
MLTFVFWSNYGMRCKSVKDLLNRKLFTIRLAKMGEDEFLEAKAKSGISGMRG